LIITRLIRTRLGPTIIRPVAIWLRNAGITPNTLTGIGLCLAILAAFLFAILPGQTYLAAAVLSTSCLMDLLDGAVGKVSRVFTGSFNDEIADRISEIAIYCGLFYTGTPGVILLLALGFSLSTSYVRIKAESLGEILSEKYLGAQRAERLLPLIVFAFVGLVWIGAWINLILVFVTFTLRSMYVTKALNKRRKRKEGNSPHIVQN
jgi:phosphatidylglycerophosphate synthase